MALAKFQLKYGEHDCRYFKRVNIVVAKFLLCELNKEIHSTLLTSQKLPAKQEQSIG